MKQNARSVGCSPNFATMTKCSPASARIVELQLAGETLDDVSGLPKGYASKLTAPRPTRRIGAVSFGPMLGVLGMKCLFVEDEDAVRRVAGRLKRRNSNLVRSAASEFRLTHRWLRKIARKGGKSRDAKLTPEQRSELARELNRIRWSKPRVVQVKRLTAKKLRNAA
jgi:hypothetical protein